MCLLRQNVWRDKIVFVATKYFCCDKHLVMTNICCDKIMFVATSILLSRQKMCFFHDKHMFVMTKCGILGHTEPFVWNRKVKRYTPFPQGGGGGEGGVALWVATAWWQAVQPGSSPCWSKRAGRLHTMETISAEDHSTAHKYLTLVVVTMIQSGVCFSPPCTSDV